MIFVPFYRELVADARPFGTSASIVTATAVTRAMRLLNHAPHFPLRFSPGRQASSGQCGKKQGRHRSEVLDKTQRNNVFVKIRILDLSQRVDTNCSVTCDIKALERVRD